MKKSPYIDSKRKKILVAGGPGKSARSENESLRAEIEVLRAIIKDFGVDEQHLHKLIQQKTAINLPVSIFRSRSSTLEVIVRYLHDVKQMRFVDIAAALNRDQRTIWHAYKRSALKQASNVLDSHIGSHIDSKTAITIPVSIFSDRTYAPLEMLVMHLKDSHNLSFSEIAELLARSRKTIWTVYQRAKKKHAQ